MDIPDQDTSEGAAACRSLISTLEIERHRQLSAQARRITIGQAANQTVWREWGSGSPVILLHGGYGSWTHWTRNIAVLATARRVLVPDTPGFGESDLPEAMDAATIVRSLWDNLDQLIGAAGMVDIVGFSYGGGLAGEMAAARPARIGRIVLVGSGGLGMPKGYREELVRWRDLDVADQREAHRRNLRILMFAKPETADDLAVALQVANAAAARMNSKKLRGGIDLSHSLSGKKVALSGIWGEKDYTLGGLPLASRERVVRSLDPAAEWVALPGVGHWAQYEAAQAFNTALLGILDKPRAWAQQPGASTAEQGPRLGDRERWRTRS